ncbi:MAG: succinate dehydrogenase [Candidatus Polarisedimenticolia bacterium]
MGMYRFGQTARRDTWWSQPLVALVVLSSFVVYATWAALQGRYYHWGPYLSPFYSPELFGESPHALFGPKPSWFPAWLPWSPALLILWAPGMFRLTCYYYRGAYYKSFWADPPACAVGEPRRSYLGEASFPLILQNTHRLFVYLALLFLIVLAHDVWKAMWFVDPATGQATFGIGLGTLVLAANVILLGGYTLGCHSLRNLAGGYLNTFSRAPVRACAYTCVSSLNRGHMRWAWLSLFMVAFADIYVRLCAAGIWHDVRFL